MSTDFHIRGDTRLDTKGFSDALGKLSEVTKKGIGSVVKTIGVASTAIGVLSTMSIKAYADYEQLVGGVETLFGTGGKSIEKYAESVGKSVDEITDEYNRLIESETTVLNNADRAYQTAGISANKYMETVTSFSASLLQGLGGDTQKAAEIADKAIVDMADNANKMGTSIEMIQNAYQGFAKQNYTMLDNLKLGYGGTQAEMARLINDSGVLGNTMKVTEKTVNSVSFDKIIEAIHIVQERMGIAGTTAKEASETISGSIASMKAQWENLQTALVAEGWDIGIYIENFADSVKTVVENIAPRIVEALPNIATALIGLFEALGPYLSQTIQTLAPILIEGAVRLVGKIAKNIPKIFSTLAQAIYKAFKNIFDSLPPEIQEKIEGIFDAFNDWLPVITGITTAILAFRTVMAISSLIDGARRAIQSFKLANDAATLSQAALNFVMSLNPFVLIATLIAGVVAALVVLWNTNEDFRNAVIGIWDKIKQVFSDAWEFIKQVWDTVYPYFKQIWDGIYDVIKSAIEAIKSILEFLAEIGKQVAEKLSEFFSWAWESIKSVWDNVKPYFDAIWAFIKDIFSVVAPVIGGFFSTAWDAIVAVWDTVTGYFQNIFNTIEGIFDGITALFKGDFEGAWNAIVDVLSGWGDFFQGLFDDIFNIFSKISEVFYNVGKNIIDSIKNGIKSVWDNLVNWWNDIWDNAFGKKTINVDVVKNERTVSSTAPSSGKKGRSLAIDGSHRTGLFSVPFDGYIAELHKGERVLTAQQAKQYEKDAHASIASNQSYGSGMLATRVATVGAMSNHMTLKTDHTATIELDGRTVGKLIAPYVDRFLF